MAVKGMLEGWFGGRLGVWGPRTLKLPRAPRNGDPALRMCYSHLIVKKAYTEGMIFVKKTNL